MRMLFDNETVTCDGKPVPGAFAVDEQGGVVRRYVLNGHGERVMEGERSKVETLRGKVVVSKGSTKPVKAEQSKSEEKANESDEQ